MASGDTLVTFFPEDNQPPLTNFATLDVRGATSPIPVLDFDTTTGEIAVFTGIMPQHYGAGGVTVFVHWAASSATTGTIGWLVAFQRIGDSQQDIDADGFAADNTITATTVPGTSGHVDITSITFTDGADMDSVAVGESFRLRLTRDVAGDSAAGDAECLGIEIRET